MLCIDGSNFALNSSQMGVQGRPFSSSHWPKQGVVPTYHPLGRTPPGQIRTCDVTSLFDHSKWGLDGGFWGLVGGVWNSSNCPQPGAFFFVRFQPGVLILYLLETTIQLHVTLAWSPSLEKLLMCVCLLFYMSHVSLQRPQFSCSYF